MLLTKTQIPTLLNTHATTDLNPSLNFCHGDFGGGGLSLDLTDPISYQSANRPALTSVCVASAWIL